MILSITQDTALDTALDEIGLRKALREGGSVLVKVNLSHLPEPLHPRTDPVLLLRLLRYIAGSNTPCAIAEGANGFLQHNLESIGLGDMLKEYHINVIDLDLEEVDCVRVDGEEHYLPKCLTEYAVRVGFPATSKRPGMLFSNNIKLFVGAVPRRMYQGGGGNFPRPAVHLDLHRSVANIYRAIMTYAPFHFFINGGKAMFEGLGEILLQETFVSNDGLELDQLLLNKFGIESPDYLKRLTTSPSLA